jgi:enamine deaminase RidA (YjgF/YER057c/UK114 family)
MLARGIENGTSWCLSQECAWALHQRLRELAELTARHDSWSSVLFVNLHLANMSHFCAANAAYCAVVPQRGAPARACVELPFSTTGFKCTVDVLVQQKSHHMARKVLHVQSVSEWAPACIGPYSQATLAAGLLCMAGQIPLEPATMEVWPTSLLPMSGYQFTHCWLASSTNQ